MQQMKDDEAPSTSCAEEAPRMLEAPGRARAAWKVAAGVVAATLVVVAGGSWAHRAVSAGSAFMGLMMAETDLDWPPPYQLFRNYGCSNWEAIESNRSVVPNEATCKMLCTEDENCVSYNWQGIACQEGWKVANGCITYSGTCETEENPCFELFYKLEYPAPTPTVPATTATVPPTTTSTVPAT